MYDCGFWEIVFALATIALGAELSKGVLSLNSIFNL